MEKKAGEGLAKLTCFMSIIGLCLSFLLGIPYAIYILFFEIVSLGNISRAAQDLVRKRAELEGISVD